MTFLSKPYNVILLLMGIVFTVTTVAPIVAIVQDTLKIHPGTIDAHLTGKATPSSTTSTSSPAGWQRRTSGSRF